MRYSIEAEQSVIGGLLINPSKLDDLAEFLATDDFYQIQHQLIFSAIVDLADSGQAIDHLTVAEHMHDRGELERVDGGLGYLAELSANTPSTSGANVVAYGRIVAERAMERRITEAGRRIAELGADPETPVDDKLNQLHDEFERLERNDAVESLPFGQLLKNCIQRIDQKFRGEAVDTIKTGFAALDERLVIEPSDLWVLAARPSMGKTALAMNIAYNVAMTGKEVLVFSMEMSKEQLGDRLLCSASGLPTNVIRSGQLVDDQWSKLSAGVAKLKELKIHIIEIPGIDINRALGIARKFAKRGNIGLVVVDYLQLMSAPGKNRIDVVSEVSRKLKVMAKTINAPVLALSQLSRNCENRSDNNKRPRLSDLRETGQIEQDADIISFIYRDEVYNENSQHAGIAEIITGKFRNGEIGTDYLGTQLQFSRFVDIDHIPEPIQSRPARIVGGFS